MTGWSNASVYGTSRYRTPNNTHKYALQVAIEVAQSLNPKVRTDRDVAYLLTDRLERAKQDADV